MRCGIRPCTPRRGRPRRSVAAAHQRGRDVNVADAGGHTAFHIAAEAGYVPVARALFERGADAHAVDAEDRTPLSRAAAKGHTDIVDLINVVE